MTKIHAVVDASGFPTWGALMVGFLALLVLSAGLFGWGAYATIDGGTVREILVHDGDTVKACNVLSRLNDMLPRSEAAILQAEYAELVTRRNRLEAEFLDADAISWSPELSRLAQTNAAVREILDGQQRLFEVRALVGLIAVLALIILTESAMKWYQYLVLKQPYTNTEIIDGEGIRIPEGKCC